MFWKAKSGNAAEEYEDALAAEAATGRFAVADGASESSYSGLWARILVEEFTHLPAGAPFAWTEWLPAVQARWASEIGERPGQQAWFVQSKIASGSFATFAGLSITDGHEKRWQSWAVGDSCVFQIRNNKIYNSFPLSRSDQFGVKPLLIGSRSSVTEIDQNRSDHISGGWETGDQFWLMTDALSQWFFSRNEAEAAPVRQVLRILAESEHNPDSFGNWAQKIRDSGDLHNDDVTLLIVEA